MQMQDKAAADISDPGLSLAHILTMHCINPTACVVSPSSCYIRNMRCIVPMKYLGSVSLILRTPHESTPWITFSTSIGCILCVSYESYDMMCVFVHNGNGISNTQICSRLLYRIVDPPPPHMCDITIQLLKAAPPIFNMRHRTSISGFGGKSVR